MQRLLDLYLSGEFEKDILIDRKITLERTIAELEKERSRIKKSLIEQEITPEQE
jgi:hypothetical protein